MFPLTLDIFSRGDGAHEKCLRHNIHKHVDYPFQLSYDKETPINKCWSCDSDYEEHGALLFGPPDLSGKCDIHHICPRCFYDVIDGMENER